jgi:hypothetical protein
MTEIELLDNLKKDTCVLCGEDLLLLKEPIIVRCDYCGKKGKTSHQCTSEHFICDECLSGSPYDFIKTECLNYKGLDPIELAIKIMNSPHIRMHGAEHHLIVPAVMTSILHNKNNSFTPLNEELDKLEVLILNEAPKQCSLVSGTCGAAIGSGMFIEEYLKNQIPAEKYMEFSRFVKTESIKQIDEIGLSRCCKRDTYISLQVTAKFLNDNFGLNLPSTAPKCTFSLRNKSCGREDCPFFNLANDIG